MPTFITMIVPDDKVDAMLAAAPAPSVHTATTLPEKKFQMGAAIWAGRYGLPAITAVLEQWQRMTKPRKDVH